MMRNDLHLQNSRENGRQQLPNNRFTFGFLNCTISHLDMQLVWAGVHDVAREYQANLIFFDGGVLHDPRGFQAQANVVYDLVNPERLDGLIVWLPAIDWVSSPTDIAAFLQRYRPLLIVCGEKSFTGIPGIIFDNYQGMRDVMLHLIEEHGHRRIAFIRGPENHLGAQERYRAYTEIMTRYDVLDLNLVGLPGPWGERHGAETMSLLLDHRKLTFDAVVGACDDFAIGALNVLQARGIAVPEHVAVTGFDDNESSKAITPPLTTARPPFYQMGRQAAETLLTMIAGAESPPQIFSPVTLVIRQSCGCINPAVVSAGVVTRAMTVARPREKLMPFPGRLREMLVMRMQEALGSVRIEAERLGPLVDAFVEDLEDISTDSFLSGLGFLLRQMMAAGNDVGGWQQAISAFRQDMRPVLPGDEVMAHAEGLWHQARVMIGEMAQRFQSSQLLRVEQYAQILSELEQKLITAFDIRELMNILAEGLPQLGIRQCCLVLYVDPARPQEEVRLILAYNEAGRIPLVPDGRLLPAARMVPEELLCPDRPASVIVEALYFRDTQIGIVGFEANPLAGKMYHTLRGVISSALQGALLVRRVQENAIELAQKNHELRQYHDHLEDLVNARTAELARSNALLQAEILERTRMEQSLSVSEQQYRLLAENVQDGIVIVQDQTIVFVNNVFAIMAGSPLEQLLALDPAHVFQASDKQQFCAWLAPDTLDTAATTRWQTKLVTRNGLTLWIELEQTPIVWNSQPAILLTVRDITDRKRREQRLEDERARLYQENVSLRSTIKERYRFGELVGKSLAMQRVYELILNAAGSEVNLLVVGESGTGKELIARTLHQVSQRKTRAFVPVNCASIPETLFEREFFGHRKGAFTGADRDTSGVFDKAHRGTLFLDEVTELTPATQAKLLRVLQDGQYTPLGSTTIKQADVLIVAATNKNCQEEIARGRLRKDFFYRIGVIELAVPPLRDRKDDLPLLIEYILEHYRQRQLKIHGKLSEDLPTDHSMLPGELVQMLYAYDWPGNVRELQNILQRYLATRDLTVVRAALGGLPGLRTSPAVAPSLPEAVTALEKRMIAEALVHTRHHIGKTVELLKVPRRTLQRKIKLYGLEREA